MSKMEPPPPPPWFVVLAVVVVVGILGICAYAGISIIHWVTSWRVFP